MISTSYFDNESIVSIAAGENHSLALSSTGKVYSFGYNNSGQLGNGGNYTCKTPVLAFSTVGGSPVAYITTGYNHGLCISTTHKVYSWGGNGSGELGTGNTTGSFSPVAVTKIGSEYLFANALSEYKTCIDYEAAYSELSDDYEALDSTAKSNLSTITFNDYNSQADYESGTKTKSVSALTKWNEICALHNATTLSPQVMADEVSLGREITLVGLAVAILFTCVGVITIKAKKRV